jgi:hypothetical protein
MIDLRDAFVVGPVGEAIIVGRRALLRLINETLANTLNRKYWNKEGMPGGRQPRAHRCRAQSAACRPPAHD